MAGPTSRPSDVDLPSSHAIQLVRDTVSYMVGLGIIVYQTVVGSTSTERPVMLGVAVAMIGVPTFLSLAARDPK